MSIHCNPRTVISVFQKPSKKRKHWRKFHFRIIKWKIKLILTLGLSNQISAKKTSIASSFSVSIFNNLFEDFKLVSDRPANVSAFPKYALMKQIFYSIGKQWIFLCFRCVSSHWVDQYQKFSSKIDFKIQTVAIVFNTSIESNQLSLVRIG